MRRSGLTGNAGSGKARMAGEASRSKVVAGEQGGVTSYQSLQCRGHWSQTLWSFSGACSWFVAHAVRYAVARFYTASLSTAQRT